MSATLVLGVDDEERDNEKPKLVWSSGAKPGGEARKSPNPNIEQSRQNYVNARDDFHAALNPESEINHGDVIEAAQALIETRLELYRLLVADTDNPDIQSAYLASLLIDLQNILTQALPSANILCQGGMHAFLEGIFGKIDCEYDPENPVLYLEQALKASGYIDDDATQYLLTLFESGYSDLQSLIAMLNDNFNTLQKDPRRASNLIRSTFWMTIYIESIGENNLMDLLEVSDNWKHTPLHMACYNGDAGYIKVLIDSKILTSKQWRELLGAKTIRGATPLHLAFLNKNAEIFTVLLEYCQKDSEFAKMLKELLVEIQQNNPMNPCQTNKETRTAFQALLAWLNDFNPNAGCNANQYTSHSDDDDDAQGDGASNNDSQSNSRPVITITRPGTLPTDHNTGQTSSSSPRQASAFSWHSRSI